MHAALIPVIFLACSTEQRPKMIRSSQPDTEGAATASPSADASVTSDGAVGESKTSEQQPKMDAPNPTTPTNTATTGAAKASGTVVVSATLVQPANKGRYGLQATPVHAHAIWITDANDNYIKTINAQAATRAVHLQRWRSFTGTQPDGVTGATVVTNATTGNLPSVMWDLKDKAGAVVPNGNYKIWFEWTESNTTGTPLVLNTRSTLNQPLDSLAGYSAYILPITVGPQGSTKMDTASPVFTNLKAVHTP